MIVTPCQDLSLSSALPSLPDFLIPNRWQGLLRATCHQAGRPPGLGSEHSGFRSAPDRTTSQHVPEQGVGWSEWRAGWAGRSQTQCESGQSIQTAQRFCKELGGPEDLEGVACDRRATGNIAEVTGTRTMSLWKPMPSRPRRKQAPRMLSADLRPSPTHRPEPAPPCCGHPASWLLLCRKEPFLHDVWSAGETRP